MAGAKYILNWSDLRGKSYSLEIWEVGISYENSLLLKGTDKPCTISWQGGEDLLSPIKSSRAEINFYATTDFQYQEFFATEVGEYMLKVYEREIGYEDYNLIWEGINIDCVYTEPYSDIPYVCKMTFSDGLSELASYDFLDDDGVFYIGYKSFKDIIQICLNKLPYQLKLLEVVNVYDKYLPAPPNTVSTLSSYKIDIDVFNFIDDAGNYKSKDCLFVLKEIMTALGCRIFQSNNSLLTPAENIWWIQRVEELSGETESQRDYMFWTSTGVKISKGILSEWKKTITNTEVGITFLNADAELEIIPAIKKINYTYKKGYKKNNLILDPLFEHWNFDPVIAGGYYNTAGYPVTSNQQFIPVYWHPCLITTDFADFNHHGTNILSDDYIQWIYGNAQPTRLRLTENLLSAYPSIIPFLSSKFIMALDGFIQHAWTTRYSRQGMTLGTDEKLLIRMRLKFHRKINNTQIQKNIPITLKIGISLIDYLDSKYLAGNISSGTIVTALTWASGSQFLNVSEIIDEDLKEINLTILTPAVPYSDPNCKCRFVICIPDRNDIYLAGVKTNYIDYIDIIEASLFRIGASGTSSTDDTEIIVLQENETIRDNDYNIKNLIGQGDAVGEDGAVATEAYTVFYLSEQWSRLHSNPKTTLKMEDCFLINVLKKFCSYSKMQISGTLYGLTDFYFQNPIITDKGMRCIISQMEWNLKTGEKHCVLQELTTGESTYWHLHIRKGTAIPAIALPNINPVILPVDPIPVIYINKHKVVPVIIIDKNSVATDFNNYPNG